MQFNWIQFIKQQEKLWTIDDKRAHSWLNNKWITQKGGNETFILVSVVQFSQLLVIQICKPTVQMRKQTQEVQYSVIEPNMGDPQRNNPQKKATNKPFRRNVNHKKDLPLIVIEVYVLAFEILRSTSTISLRKKML